MGRRHNGSLGWVDVVPLSACSHLAGSASIIRAEAVPPTRGIPFSPAQLQQTVQDLAAPLDDREVPFSGPAHEARLREARHGRASAA